MRIVWQTVRRITNEILVVKGLTNRFHVAMCLFGNRLQVMSKCSKNKKSTQEAASKVLFMVTSSMLMSSN